MFRRLKLMTSSAILAALVLASLSIGSSAQAQFPFPWPWGPATESEKHIKGEPLPAIGLDAGSVTTSGISAGAFMATQLHVAYSKSIKGSGSVAGGPWNCAQNSVYTAQWKCMRDTNEIDVDLLLKQVLLAASVGDIDPLSNLKTGRLYIYNSSSDAVVKPPMRLKTLQFFERLMPSTSIQVEETLSSAHGFPTLSYGKACGIQQAPYLMKCGFDTAGEILKQLYSKTPGMKLKRGKMNPNSLHVIDQTEFGAVPAGLAETGWAYAPERCLKPDAKCKLHVALHGCLMSEEAIKDTYAIHAGYNEWAEESGIVVLYPQATRSSGNPNSCFDWFGYTGSDYANKNGPQMKVIKAMMDRLTSL